VELSTKGAKLCMWLGVLHVLLVRIASILWNRLN
jgi:hypothetical protein